MEASEEEIRAFEAAYDVPEEESEVMTPARPQASAAGKVRTLAFVAIFAGAMIYIATMFFGGDDAPPPPSTIGTDPTNPVDGGGVAEALPPPVSPITVPNLPPPVQPPAPPLPPTPPVVETPATNADTGLAPPPPPPPPPEIKAINPFGDDKKAQERLRAGMIVSGVTTGGVQNVQKGAANPQADAARDSLAQKDNNLAYLNSALKASGAEKAQATRVPSLESTIVQGKIIEAILETAINTDLPGTIRAIISRDVYAESGRAVLVPKGSRLIGSYNTGIMRGQKRVMIVWTRIIRPDGIDIQVGSPAVDSLGRAGMEGLVDNKYTELFSTAILTSMVSLGVAVIGDSVTDGNSTTTSNTDGSNTSTGSAGSNAVGQAAGNVGNIAGEIIKSALDARPTITIDQGTRINVFVNRDLSFSADSQHQDFVQ
jgi:type IV secretion system protein VirB10